MGCAKYMFLVFYVFQSKRTHLASNNCSKYFLFNVNNPTCLVGLMVSKAILTNSQLFCAEGMSNALCFPFSLNWFMDIKTHAVNNQTIVSIYYLDNRQRLDI